jgi:hypothetical protein
MNNLLRCIATASILMQPVHENFETVAASGASAVVASKGINGLFLIVAVAGGISAAVGA